MSKETVKKILKEIEKVETELDKWQNYNNSAVIAELQKKRDHLYGMLPEG